LSNINFQFVFAPLRGTCGGVNTLVLIAACGEWWRFKIATRKAYSTAGDILDGVYNRKASQMVDYKSALPKPKGPRPTHACRHVGDRDVDQLKPLEDEWSSYMSFGSKVLSNQRMYIIHKLLRELRDGLNGGGIPDYDSQVRIPFWKHGHRLTVISGKR